MSNSLFLDEAWFSRDIFLYRLSKVIFICTVLVERYAHRLRYYYFCHFLNLIMWLTEIYIKNWKRGTLRIELTISWYVKSAPTSHQQQDWSSQCVPFEVDFWLMHPTLNSIQRIGISKKFMFHLCATQEAFFFTFATLLLYYLFRKWNFLFLPFPQV